MWTSIVVYTLAADLAGSSHGGGSGPWLLMVHLFHAAVNRFPAVLWHLLP